MSIPRYDDSDPLHVRLSQLGKAAQRECAALVANSDIPTKPAGDAQSREARRLLRHEWQPTSEVAQAIEDAVAELLATQRKQLWQKNRCKQREVPKTPPTCKSCVSRAERKHATGAE